MESKPLILLIDDNVTTIRLNTMVIEKVDKTLAVLTAPDGKAALDLLQHCEQENCHFPGLIFVDLKMPAMDGLEFFKRFQESFQDRVATTKVVMLTTSMNMEDFKTATAAGISLYLNKPLTTQKVNEVLEMSFLNPAPCWNTREQ
jgi:CheY-like chemotaxis protein